MEPAAGIAGEALEIAKADTLCADLYLNRARELVSAELTPAQYAALHELSFGSGGPIGRAVPSAG